FDFSRLARYRPAINPKVLGLVGSVPRSKRLDLALDITERLKVTDPEFRLDIQGKEYSEYPWLLNRDEEREYFEKQYARISTSSSLNKAVTFGGNNPNITEWYSSVPGFILSTSDHEGTHQAVAEGGAAGSVPIVFPRAGAEMVYGDRWMVDSVEAAVERIRYFNANLSEYNAESKMARRYMSQHFRPNIIAKKIIEILEA